MQKNINSTYTLLFIITYLNCLLRKTSNSQLDNYNLRGWGRWGNKVWHERDMLQREDIIKNKIRFKNI